MKQYDLVIQLGSQVKWVNYPLATDDGHYELAPHTAMRTKASAIALQKGVTQKLMIAGGSNFGVRYDDQLTFNGVHPTQKNAIFTFDAFADADFTRKSEAAVIKDFLVRDYGIDSSRIFAETLSATTEENAEFVKIVLKRRPMFTGNEKIAILTNLYHIERALSAFRGAGLNVEPLFAENVLTDDNFAKIDRICDYYKTPRGGKQYNVDRIRQLLTEGKSLEELLFPWWCVTFVDGYVCADGTPEELEKTHTYFAQAATKGEAAVKIQRKYGLTEGDFERYIKGPFDTHERARKG